jgi:hypothetical protein
MFKKLACILISILIIFSLVGCASVVSTKTEMVEVVIVDIDKDPMICTGKVVIPADYDILLKHSDLEVWVDISRSEYDIYKDLVGTTMTAELITTEYDDGTIKRQLELLED